MSTPSEHQCEKCGSYNSVGAIHCSKCGSELNSACPVCGSSFRNEVFCGNCGQALSDEVTSRSIIGSGKEDIPDQDDRKLPIPGQIVKLVKLSVTAYRKNFRSFLMLSLISGIPLFIFTVYFDTKISSNLQSNNPSDSPIQINMEGIGSVENLFIIICLIFLIAISGLITTATIAFGSAQYAEEDKVSVITCLNYALPCTGRLLGLSMLLLALLIVPILLSFLIVGIPLLLFLLVRWNFAICSIVIENTGVVESLTRSWSLVSKRWWVTFGTGLIVTILALLPAIAFGLIGSVIASSGGNPIISQIFDTLATIIITPFIGIATAIYFLGLRKTKDPNYSNTSFPGS